MSDHPTAAIDQERLSGDISGLFAREEGDTAGDILRLGDVSGRRCGLDFLEDGGRQPVVGTGRGRREEVSCQAMPQWGREILL